MRIPVIRLPVTVANPDLPSVSPSDLKLAVPYEFGALAHWVFGDDSSSLTSRISDHVLTASGTVTYDAESVILAGSSGYLQSTLLDTTSYSVIAIHKRPTIASDGNFWALVDNFTTSPLAGMSVRLQRSAGVDVYTAVAVDSSGAGGIPAAKQENVVIPSPPAIGAWTAAVAVIAGADGSEAVLKGRIGNKLEKTALITPAVPNGGANTIRIGHSYQTSGFVTTNRNIAEVIIFDRALTDAEIENVLQRARIRCAGRGITVVV